MENAVADDRNQQTKGREENAAQPLGARKGLVSDKGAEVTLGDDGNVVSTKDGKTETLAKVEGGADARRTAVLVTTILVAKPSDAPARCLIVCTPAGFEGHFARILARKRGVEPPEWALGPLPEVTVV